MAIAYDANTDGGQGSGGSLTYTHTCGSGSNLKLFIYVIDGQASGQAVTVGGNSATLVDNSGVNAAGANVVLFYYDNPSVGSNSIHVTSSGATPQSIAISYTGCATGTPEAHNAGVTGTNVTSITESVTTITDNDWTLLAPWGAGAVSASTGSTLRYQNSGTGLGWFDSGGVIHPAGSYSMTVTGPNNKWAYVMCTIQPLGATNFTRSLSDSITTGASRSVTVGRIWNTARALSDSFMNGASRVATVGKGLARSLSDAIMNAASRFATLAGVIIPVTHFTRALSDSIMNAASRFATMVGSYFSTMSKSAEAVLSYFYKNRPPTDYD